MNRCPYCGNMMLTEAETNPPPTELQKSLDKVLAGLSELRNNLPAYQPDFKNMTIEEIRKLEQRAAEKR